MPKFEIVLSGFVGSSIFSPYLRGEKRTFTIFADSEEHARKLHSHAVEGKEPNVLGAGGTPLKIVSITEVESEGE